LQIETWIKNLIEAKHREVEHDRKEDGENGKTGIKYRKLRALHHDTKAPIPSFNSLFPCLRSRSVEFYLINTFYHYRNYVVATATITR
jgi:hypothetical protein